MDGIKITNLWDDFIMPGFGCWSQDQTTARLGKTNDGGKKMLRIPCVREHQQWRRPTMADDQRWRGTPTRAGRQMGL